jgi:predicted permease
VLAYVLGLSTATSVFFGLLPARSALRLDLVSALKDEGSGSPERQRLRRLMVTAQVAVCSALVVWSVLFLRSLGNIHAIAPGFEASGVVLSTVELDRGAIDPQRGDQILTQWTQAVAASAGVQSAALATVVPLALTGREEFDVSLPTDAQGTRRRVVANRITPGWFATVRVPLVAGRDFTWNDRTGTPRVAIVNETLARQFWNGTALGQRVVYGDRSLEIVGVAADSKYRTLGERIQPLIYLPLRQEYIHFVTLHARTSDARATARLMTSELQRLLPGADANANIESMADAVAVAVLPARIGATVTTVFGVLALALAACGVYGLVSFSVLQRAREIGIRRAVGATATDIVRLVLRHHATLIGVGLAIGVTTGSVGAMLLRTFLAGVNSTDPIAVSAAVALVTGSAVAASTLPALRATQLDPIVALRDQ